MLPSFSGTFAGAAPCEGLGRRISAMKILIVEDEKKSASYLKKGLQEAGFVADVADNGEDGLDLALRGDYDLLLLDIMLPGCDGWHILTEVRRRNLQLPVMFLNRPRRSERPGQRSGIGRRRLSGQTFRLFRTGRALAHHLLRRGPARQGDVLSIADLEIDSQRHRVTHTGQQLDLTAKEFSLLLLLGQRCGEVLTRTYIAERVWDMNFDSETNIIDVHIRRLRQKIDAPFPTPLIHTVRGVGYVLEHRR